jgi:hypothetical protein
MLVLEFKAYGKVKQFVAVDEAIRVTQFIRIDTLSAKATEILKTLRS